MKSRGMRLTMTFSLAFSSAFLVTVAPEMLCRAAFRALHLFTILSGRVTSLATPLEVDLLFFLFNGPSGRSIGPKRAGRWTVFSGLSFSFSFSFASLSLTLSFTTISSKAYSPKATLRESVC